MYYGLVETATLKIADCLVLGLFADDEFSEIAKKLDHQHNQLISRLFSKLHEAGDSLWQSELEGHSLLLFHCGKKSEFKSKTLGKYLKEIVPALIKQGFSSACIALPQLSERQPDWQMEHMVVQVDASIYQLTDFLSKKKNSKLDKILFFLPEASNQALKEGQALAAGIKLTRTLGDYPANICTPSYLAEQAIALAQMHGPMTVKIMGPEELKILGMNALLAVAQGSQEEPRFIELQYCGGADTSPVVLVGKGITFDSGGLSIKPANLMDEMKYDMCGAAAVLGAFKTCALLNLPINLIGLIPTAENMPSGTAVKPGDIVTSMSGQTIEILNTDAEGRLILADALTYAERFSPNCVLDLATLTGGIIVALGYLSTGFMTEDEDLAKKIIEAARECEEKIWRMPLDEDYQEALQSPFADMINAAFDRTASSTTGACFLSRFTKNYSWAHFDIAGTAWVPGKKRAATGRPVSLVIQFLRHVCNSR